VAANLCVNLLVFTGEPIRFRVTAENFVETSPSGPENPDIVTAVGEASAEEPKVPYTLTVCISYCDRFNPLAPSDQYMGRTAPLTSRRCILNIYSTNICTEYFKRAA
jgi:hypothetical protein